MIDAIEAAVARLARGRHKDARQELRDHLLADCEAHGGSTDQAAVDAAIERLGGPAAIREAFFPRPEREPVPTWLLATFIVMAAAMAAIVVFTDTGDATCTVTDGTCRASSKGLAADAVLLAAVPLAALACLMWLPAWTALVPTVPGAFVTLMRATTTLGEPAPDVALFVVMLAALGLAIRHMFLERRRNQA